MYLTFQDFFLATFHRDFRPDDWPILLAWTEGQNQMRIVFENRTINAEQRVLLYQGQVEKLKRQVYVVI
jgi:hypothetical protein